VLIGVCMEDLKDIKQNHQEHDELWVQIPKEIIKKLKIQKNEDITLQVKEHTIEMKFPQIKSNKQEIALLWFLLPALLCSVLFYVFFSMLGFKQIALTKSDPISIVSVLITLGLLSGILCFIYFFIKGKQNKIITTTKDIYWRNFLTIIVSFTIVIAFVLFFLFWVIGLLFGGISFDLITSTLLFFVLTCMINYSMIYLAIHLTSTMLTNILMFTIIAGVTFAMITNGKQQWWQYNFSFLGTPNATSAWGFNITLIFSALLLMALIDYLFVVLKKAYPKSRRLAILRVLLTLVAINFGGVGLFPYNDHKLFQMIHDKVAHMLVYLIILLIILLRWLLPKCSKEFLRLSYAIAFGLILATILWLIVGYFSLTAFELIAFILAFTWLFLLLQQLRELASNTSQVYITTIKDGGKK